MSDVRIIKRYSNRKMYDLKDSRYVTLQEIADVLQGGEEVQIVDNKSKEDITAVTLAQILYEQEKKKSGMLPLSALKGIIRSSGELLQRTFAAPVMAIKGEAEKTVQSIREEAERKVNTLKVQAEKRVGKLLSNSRDMGDEAKAVVAEVTRTTQAAVDEFTRALDERFKHLSRFTRFYQAQKADPELLARLEVIEERVGRLESEVKSQKSKGKSQR